MQPTAVSTTFRKVRFFKWLFIILCFSLSLHSCKDKYSETFTANVPIYMDTDEWRSLELNAQAPRLLSEPGKIYIYQDYLFIVEVGEGIHIVNNATPSSPQNMAFLPVIGCTDVAVQNDVLYVDSYFDLLAFSISTPSNPELQCRITDAFEMNRFPVLEGFDEAYPAANINNREGIIVGWTQKEVSEESQAFESMWGMANDAEAAISPSNSVGIGGSMAQFAIALNHLYVLRSSSITSFNLEGELCPQTGSETTVNRVAETIFPYNDHLFLGTTTGMLIYDLNSPGSPQFVSSVDHFTACDPVVVQDDRAYFTIRTGTECNGFLNQLHVVDVTDYSSPQTLAMYDMVNPHGLGIDGATLFVCDGSDGLKVYDAEDDMQIDNNMIEHYENIDTYDVIPFNDILIMTAEEGIYQYDYSDPENIIELSFMPAN